jgi:tetratricopeptide (TPR) repeat protein
LATPGDLADERLVVKTTVEEHNRRHRARARAHFEVVGWEQVRGTARRPQEEINELISESHFMVVLFKERWGSEPGSPWGYTSGTEEELFTGLLELGQSDQPMRDVWVSFMKHATPEERVKNLKQQMINDHPMLFENTADLRELKEKLAERLTGWEEMALAAKSPRHIDLISSTGKEMLKAARLRVVGEKLVELGQPIPGRASLQEAAALGGPIENLAFAQLLARQGELDEALQVTQDAIDQCVEGASPIFSSLMAEALAAQAGVLRRQGKLNDAVGRLESALSLLAQDDDITRRIRSRILDDLGIATQKLERYDDAAVAFNEALDIRETSGTERDVAQSLVNLARLAVANGDLSAALDHALAAEEKVKNSAPTALHANIATLLAQVYLRDSKSEVALKHADRALALNRQFANTRGVAIAHLLLAQCYRADSQIGKAEEHARKCKEVNEKMSNADGAARAEWLLQEMGVR